MWRLDIARRKHTAFELHHGATLDAQARSESARAVTELLANELTRWESWRPRGARTKRKGRIEKLQTAIGAFLADLLSARNDPDANGWTWRSLNKSGFTGHAVSFRDFDAVVSAWLACGLLERVAGFKEPVAFEPGDQLRVRGKASRFRATPKLLALCAEHGITPQNAGEHFAYRPPEDPLRLNATKSRRGTGGVAIAEILSIQVRLGRAAADLDVAELLLRRAVDTAQTPSPPPLALRARTMVIVRAPPNFASVPSTP